MRLFVERLPGDPRTLPADERWSPRPTVLELGASDAALDDHLATHQARGALGWVEVGCTRDVERAATAGASLWIRGHEAGGRCGSMGAVVLIRAAVASGRPWVVQGLGRRGMAAALALGATGVQLDVHTWLLADSPLPAGTRAALAKRTARDTTVLDGVRQWSDLPVSCAIRDAKAGPELATWLPAFADELADRIDRLRAHHALQSDPFGTGTPIVKGPMANVSERPGLAAAVRKAGGLPFCALGAIRPSAAVEVLDGMNAVPGPWGVGIIGFDVMPHRDAHLDAVRTAGPRPVILAGGSPALALALQADGLAPWLHTPSARLAGMALRRGVQAVVFEGREAGGHVGKLSSASLWEEALAVAEPLSPALLVLAGGIGDRASAAFAAAMAADAHQRGHRIGFQVGTAFFFTHEIVESGQITASYQQRALAASETVCVGDTVDLPLQCVPNAYTRAAIAQEHAWAEDELPLRERRERVEHHNLGRTRVAAKGIEREGPGRYRAVPVRRQLDEGAFTMGQGATVSKQLGTVAQLIDELTVQAARLLAPDTSDTTPWPVVTAVQPPPMRRLPHVRQRSFERQPIAIVGMGCVLPGAPNVPSYWNLLHYGMNAITPIPDSRWAAHRYFHPDPTHRATTSYVRMAGMVVDFAFDSAAFGIPPSVVPSMDRAQQLTLVAAAEALRTVRIADRSTAGVVIGNSMGGEHAKSLALRVRFREVLTALGADGDLGLEDAVDAWLGQSLPPVDVESMSGLLSNVIAGRVASWLDLGGGNTTVDAACAASLSALTTAVDSLRTGRCDVVLTGGVDADLAPETFVGFCRTHALSATGSQPFSAHADGFVMGEGAVVFVLKRLCDAERDGDTVHALVRGIGQSSDGRSSGITAPKVSGQELAIRRALADAALSPDAVALIEAHGTGTALGDRTELSALGRVYPRALIGSVKSQIGHLKGGAGAAGMLKAVLALSKRVIPPTLNAGPVRPGASSGFTFPRTASAFPEDARHAAVSAFGFGGTNFHVVLEGVADRPTTGLAGTTWSKGAPLLEVFAATTRPALVQRIRTGQTTTPEEAAQQPIRAVRLGASAGLEAWVNSGGTGAFGRTAWVCDGPVVPLVAVFPGQGSPREGAAHVLGQIPLASAVLEALDETAPDTSADPAAQHHLLVATGAAYSALLHTMDVAGVIGHSVGELSALLCAGRLSPADALALADARGNALHACPAGAMVAVSGDVPCPDACWVAADNSPGSTVFAGAEEAVEAAMAVFQRHDVKHTRLDVQRAFHSPHVQPAADALQTALDQATLTDGLPWWSNVTDVPSNAQTPDVCKALVRAVTETVGFADSLRAAREDGHRLFVHAGPGASLARHIQRTVPDARVVALHPDRTPDGLDLVRAAAQLTAEGHPGMLRNLPGTWVQIAFPQQILQRPTPSNTPIERPTVVAAAPTVTPTVLEAEPVPHDGSVRSVVLAAISDVTGYPTAALVTGATLDGDLGIDSIRKMEILGQIQEVLDVTVDEAALAAEAELDIDRLVALIETGEPTTQAPAGAPGLWGTRRVSAHPMVGPPLEVFEAGPGDLRSLVAPLLGRPVPPRVLLARAGVPAHHGLAAWMRVAALEAGVPFRAVFRSHDGPVEPRWLTGTGEVYLDGDQAYEQVPHSFAQDHPLLEAPVIFASGGTTGILRACLEAFPGARGVVFGRRPKAEAPPGFLYLSVDVTDARAVADAAQVCRETYGAIDWVVHAAGLLRDGPARNGSEDDLRAVVDVKLAGGQAMIDATLPDSPSLWVPFSSVSATLSNPGQALYAAANAALEQLEHPTARSVPIAWTAWTSVGMAADPALQRLLAARGIQSLSPDEGMALFQTALTGSGRAWAAHRGWPTTTPHLVEGPHGSTLELSPDQPALADHQVGGSALVPAALWVAGLLEQERELRDFSVVLPTRVREARTALLHDGSVTVDGAVVAKGDLHELTALTDLEPPSIPQREAQSLYGDLLFHGPAWQVLETLGMRDEWATAKVSIDALPVAQLVDAAHQLLAVWTRERCGWLGLPTSAGRWAGTAGPGSYHLVVRARAAERTATADVAVYDGEGRVVLQGQEVTLTAATHD